MNENDRILDMMFENIMENEDLSLTRDLDKQLNELMNEICSDLSCRKVDLINEYETLMQEKILIYLKYYFKKGFYLKEDVDNIV